MSTILITLIPVILGVLASLGATYALLRRQSGSIKSSEATDIWAAMKQHTDDLTRRNEFLREGIDSCNAQIAKLNDRLDDMEKKNFALTLQNGDLQRLVQQQEHTIAEQALRIHSLEDEVAALKQANFALERRADASEQEKT